MLIMLLTRAMGGEIHAKTTMNYAWSHHQFRERQQSKTAYCPCLFDGRVKVIQRGPGSEKRQKKKKMLKMNSAADKRTSFPSIITVVSPHEPCHVCAWLQMFLLLVSARLVVPQQGLHPSLCLCHQKCCAWKEEVQAKKNHASFLISHIAVSKVFMVSFHILGYMSFFLYQKRKY